MWPLLSQCRTVLSTALVSSLSRTSASLFHVLAGGASGDRMGANSPLANQSSSRLLLDRLPNQLLTPALGPMVNPACGFKVKGHLKRRCKDCFFVVRHQRLYVICKTHPRHKQMSMKKREKNTWILTDATQGPVRAW
ncbi:hypothetical protein RP20_CCG014896 [Aedes albopictus]|nr:hypothetical protein RP20_CCG014896 [Aedes albopictus]